ncbi:acid protease [Daedalea quercina L-15889]|uniref:Acid protease n=1 Tax=Daedalea quercina L-15889 TaxID=1314783 RepID=A0A165LGA4_9APHY|nr:acid protease [Daedalea quercina L-15889]
MNTFFGLLIASLCGLTNALYIPVRVNHDAQASSSGTGVHNPAIRLVGSFRQQSDDANNGSVVNFQDTVYATNMTIGGQDVLIQLDTGSSDLWVNLDEGEIEFSNTTDLPAQEAYGIGQIAGTIQFANVELGDNMVPNQAFMNVSNATNFGTIFNDGVRGILGLAFDAGSTIESTITEAYGEDSELGESFLTNVFQQDTSKPLFTVQLGRADDPQYTTEGAFTIGEYLPDYETIEDMPKLERFPNNGTGAAPRWSTVMSGMTVNGEPFQFNTSGVPGTPEGSVVAVLDTGFTFPPIPKPAVDAIYGGIDGAYYDTNSSLWIVPCNKATTLEFQFGELSVPIHPLDLTTIVQINNTQVCVNTFRPSTFPVNTQFDLVLGDAFLKNVYASFNYGNMSEDAVPYMQLLPTTDMHAASKEFDSVRSAMYAQAAASAAASSASASAASAYAALVSGSASTACSTAMPTATPLFASAWSSSAPSAVMTDSTPAIIASPDLSGLGNGNSSNPTAASSANGSSATDASSTDPAATDASSTDGSSATATSDTSTPTSTDDSSASTTSDTSASSPTDSATSSTATSTDSSTDPSATSTDSSTDPSATSTDSSTDPSATSTASAADPNATSTDSSSDTAGTTSTASAADPSATSSGDSSSGGNSSSTGSLPIDGSSSSDDGSGSLQENTSLLDNSGGSKQSTFGNSLYGDGGNGYARAFRRSYREPTKTVHDCLTPMIEEYGALLFALIAGTFIISFALCLVTVVLAIRNHSRSQARKRAEYFVLEANAEAEADPEAACTATYHYSDDY